LWEPLVTRLRVTSDRLPSSIDLPQEMARAATIVEQALDVLLPPVEGAEGRLAEAMRYATLGGGKRLRAFLVMESAALFRDLRGASRCVCGDDARVFAGA
jgi:geranylgeranyl pyrophosphate synthase